MVENQGLLMSAAVAAILVIARHILIHCSSNVALIIVSRVKKEKKEKYPELKLLDT